jgi:hypothetical protein
VAPRPFPGVVKRLTLPAPTAASGTPQRPDPPEQAAGEEAVPGPAVPMIGGGLYPHAGV